MRRAEEAPAGASSSFSVKVSISSDDRIIRRPRRRRAHERVRPTVQQMLHAMTGVPAFFRNGRLGILRTNQLGRALCSQHFDSHAQPPNTARFAARACRERNAT